MRKRSSYRPRPIIADPISYVMAGIKKIPELGIVGTELKIKNASALKALSEGTASPHDLNIIANMSNMSTALARDGKGIDWRDEIRAAADAIERIQHRSMKWGKIQATPSEVEAILLLRDIHIAQIDDACVVDIEKSIKVVNGFLKTQRKKETA